MNPSRLCIGPLSRSTHQPALSIHMPRPTVTVTPSSHETQSCGCHTFRAPSSLGVGRRIFRGERERTHAPLIHRTGAQRTSGRLLVDEDGPFAEGALALLHVGWIVDLVRHQASHARGERSSPSSEGCCVALNLRGNPGTPDATKPSPSGRASALSVDSVGYAAARRLRLPRGMYACTGSCCQQ